MLPMASDSLTFCRKAVAYLKPALAAEESKAAVCLPHSEQPMVRDLGNGLLVCYVVDDDENLVFVQHAQLESSGLDGDALHAIALENLAAGADGRISLQPYGAVHALFFDGNLEASLILLDDLWEHTLREHVTNGFAVAVPARDILAFCDVQSAEGLAELGNIIARVQSGGDHLISAQIYRREGSSWVPLARD